MPEKDNLASVEAQAVLDGIRKIVKAIRQSSVHAERSYGLSSAQLFVLRKLTEAGGPLSVNDLAKLTFTHQSSVSVVVTKLHERGFVKRVRSRQDSRRVELEVSARGLSVLKARSDVVQERLISSVRGLPAGLRRGLVRGLAALLNDAGLDSETPEMFFEGSARHVR